MDRHDMTSNKKSKRTQRKYKSNQKLAAMFKMSRDQLRQRKTSGAGVHQSGPRYTPRGEQKRRAIKDHLN